MVAGALKQYDKNAAKSYFDSSVGQEVGQFIGDYIGQKLQPYLSKQKGLVFDPNRNTFVDQETGLAYDKETGSFGSASGGSNVTGMQYDKNSGVEEDQNGNPAPIMLADSGQIMTDVPPDQAGADSPAANSAPTSHTVQRGDNLSNIAKEVYGDPNLWPAIAAANGITNPDQIRPGQELVLPAQDDLNEDAARAAAGKFYAVKEQIRQAQVAATASDVGTTSPTVSPFQAAASAAANNDNGIIPTEGLAGNVAGAFAGAGRFVSNTVEGIFGLGKTLYQGADYLLTGDETSRAAQTVKGAASLVSDSYDTYAYVATGNEKYLPGFE
ncbi:MAG TPA: LysM peptidoglycan-binding domain-containing protein, partial [Acidiferrobacterales bacterium]|nr:LysM peptidoglycan-binding domain-containing protein [Acidiferrobacterales bacterium]